MQSEAKARPQTCSSFEYAENTTAAASRPLLAWGGDSAAAETQVRRVYRRVPST